MGMLFNEKCEDLVPHFRKWEIRTRFLFDTEAAADEFLRRNNPSTITTGYTAVKDGNSVTIQLVTRECDDPEADMNQLMDIVEAATKRDGLQ
jgi:hypothetical protein